MIAWVDVAKHRVVAILERVSSESSCPVIQYNVNR